MNIPERCRDEQGYLIRQHLMTDIPYGCRTVAKVGCGFMAVYNAARYFAQPVTETEVWQFFHDRVFLRGVFGLPQLLRARPHDLPGLLQRIRQAPAPSGPPP